MYANFHKSLSLDSFNVLFIATAVDGGYGQATMPSIGFQYKMARHCPVSTTFKIKYKIKKNQPNLIFFLWL